MLDILNKIIFLFYCRILLAVQKLADEIPLTNGTKVYTAVRKNIGISISIINVRSSTTGVAVEGFRTSLFGYNTVTLKNTNKQVVPDTAIVHFFLPPSLFKRVPSNISRISAFIYDNVKLFLTSKNLSNSALVNSKVMSTSIKGVKFVDLPPEDELRSAFYPTNTALIGSSECVFWNFTLSGEYFHIIFLVLFSTVNLGIDAFKCLQHRCWYSSTMNSSNVVGHQGVPYIWLSFWMLL